MRIKIPERLVVRLNRRRRRNLEKEFKEYVDDFIYIK